MVIGNIQKIGMQKPIYLSSHRKRIDLAPGLEGKYSIINTETSWATAPSQLQQLMLDRIVLLLKQQWGIGRIHQARNQK
jgi:hypothetical protein